MLTAEIREEDCVGCTRCIQACPVDAIVGASKFMHTVLTDECIGCKLCLAPCPTDCIDIVALADKLPSTEKINKLDRAKKAKLRYKNRAARLQREAQMLLPSYSNEEERVNLIQTNIKLALKRAKIETY